MVTQHLLFHVSVTLSLFTVVYFALYSTSSTNPPSTAIPTVETISMTTYNSDSNSNNETWQATITGDGAEPGDASSSKNNVKSNNNSLVSDIVVEGERSSNIGREMLNNTNNDSNSAVTKVARKRLFPCDDISPVSFFGQRGPFWVLYNYVTATREFACDEAVTYTTHADYTFLDNLVPLLERWHGPVSLSLYSPGTEDYDETVVRIHYLRECSPLVNDFVSFHLFFDHEHIPKILTRNTGKPLSKMSGVNCSLEPKFGERIATFRKKNKLLYPVNVGRNVAREMARTHYVLASDIELYPNPNLIPNFLEMIRRNESQLQCTNPKVFVLPVFELKANLTSLPYDKLELQQMLNKSIAIPFHKYICSGCHTIPKQSEWRAAKVAAGLRVFHIGKRQEPYHHWEPIYIGTKLDPMYDERLTWEGRSDKMTQGYILCVLDYEFHILDNAFLVHRPGIKKKVVIQKPVVARQNHLIETMILPELRLLYGRRPGCYV